MLSNVWKWLSGALAVISVFLFALIKSKEAKHEKQEARQAKETAQTQARVAKSYADGERAYNDKTSRPVGRGHFTRGGGADKP